MSEKSCADVSKVARRYTHHEVVCLAECFHARIRIKIVEGLGQETCHVDGIGRGELHVTVQFCIHESVLHQRLAVVEDAIHLDGGDVLPEGGELTLLNGAYLSFGIEYIDMNTFYAKKTIGDGRTRIA